MLYNQEQQQIINKFIELTKYKFLNEKSTLKTLYFLSSNNKLIKKTFNDINKYLEFKKQPTTNLKQLINQIIKPKIKNQTKWTNINIRIKEQDKIKLIQYLKNNNLNPNNFFNQIIKEIIK